ncbi:hypothetical protein L6Q79_11035 [bacterium]|nr:hypothetical protein [bacterium]NUN47098.1 hypothetical protein [bacterium]
MKRTHQQQKEYEDIRDIIEHDAPVMSEDIKLAWVGRLFTLYEVNLLTKADYNDFVAKLGFNESETRKIYDALAGGITKREG